MEAAKKILSNYEEQKTEDNSFMELLSMSKLINNAIEKKILLTIDGKIAVKTNDGIIMTTPLDAAKLLLNNSKNAKAIASKLKGENCWHFSGLTDDNFYYEATCSECGKKHVIPKIISPQDFSRTKKVCSCCGAEKTGAIPSEK